MRRLHKQSQTWSKVQYHLKLHILLLYICHQTSKLCIVLSCKKALLEKSCCLRKYYGKHILISLHDLFEWRMITNPLIWYQKCNCNHHDFAEILNLPRGVACVFRLICIQFSYNLQSFQALYGPTTLLLISFPHILRFFTLMNLD